MVNVAAMNKATPAKKFQFVGGELCLDFCNSVGGKRGVIAREHLHTYADFISWCHQAGLLDKRQARAMARKAARRKQAADTALRRALGLREAIYRIFLALAEEQEPQATDLTHLNSELAAALGRLRVAPRSGAPGFAWEWADGGSALDQPLGPIARSAADLLTCGEAVEQVRQCRGDNCGWLFIDASKNHSRRWCDMRDCGNRAKIRRFRLKRRR